MKRKDGSVRVPGADQSGIEEAIKAVEQIFDELAPGAPRGAGPLRHLALAMCCRPDWRKIESSDHDLAAKIHKISSAASKILEGEAARYEIRGAATKSHAAFEMVPQIEKILTDIQEPLKRLESLATSFSRELKKKRAQAWKLFALNLYWLVLQVFEEGGIPIWSGQRRTFGVHAKKTKPSAVALIVQRLLNKIGKEISVHAISKFLATCDDPPAWSRENRAALHIFYLSNGRPGFILPRERPIRRQKTD